MTVIEHEQETEEYKEHKKKEYLEAIAAWKPSMTEQELFNDEDYWEQSAEEAVKKLDRKLGWNNGGNDDDGNGKGSNSKGDDHGSNSRNKSNKNGSKDYFVRKYSAGLPLAEQIMVGGRSMFLQIVDGKPKISSLIDLTKEKGMILKPNQIVGSASPIIEYEYNDLNEIEYFIDRASRMKVDDLYFLAKSIFKDVIATNEPELIILLATDTIMTFFQDQFVTTHYVVFTGPPGWGKGAILVTLKILGYRVVLAGDMSGPNLLDLLGPIEKCQVTLCEDEFDKIQDDPDKERIYKMGYEDIGSVTRTVDPSSSDRKLLYYNPYCMKFFASEKGPDVKELGGFNDRLFRAEVKKGKPKLLIKEIKRQMERSPDMQLPKYRTIISRINFLRKVLLVFRLLHHNVTIDEVPLNIENRALELCGPAIRLFNCDKIAAPNKAALKEIMPALAHFLRKKGELDKKAIELVIAGVLKELFEQMDIEEKAPGTSTILTKDSCKKTTAKNPDLHGIIRTTYTISYDEICDRVMHEVEGNLLTQRTFESADYGRVSHDSILAKCRSIFEGNNARLGSSTDKNKSARALSFDKDVVEKASKNFEVISEIRILSEDEQEKAQPEDFEDKSRWDEWTNGHSHSGGGGGGRPGPIGTNVQNNPHSGGVSDQGPNKAETGDEINDSQDTDKKTEKTVTSDNDNKDISNASKMEEQTDQSCTPSDKKIVHLYRRDQNHAQTRVKTICTNFAVGGTNGTPSWARTDRGMTEEEAEAFKAEIANLGKSKVADMAAADESGNNGLLQQQDKTMEI